MMYLLMPSGDLVYSLSGVNTEGQEVFEVDRKPASGEVWNGSSWVMDDSERDRIEAKRIEENSKFLLERDHQLTRELVHLLKDFELRNYLDDPTKLEAMSSHELFEKFPFAFKEAGGDTDGMVVILESYRQARLDKLSRITSLEANYQHPRNDLNG